MFPKSMLLIILLGISLGYSNEIALIRDTSRHIHVIDQNDDGTLLLTKEIGENGVFTSQFVVRKSGKETVLATPQAYTAIHAYRISNTDVAVGFCSRPSDGINKHNLSAIIWQVSDRSGQLLPCPEGFHGTSAFDISADGTTVSGYLIGSKPARLVPCIWKEMTNEWQCNRLPTPSIYNPYLVSSKVVISDNGKQVAGVCVVEEGQNRQNYLFRWQLFESDQWTGQKVAKQAFKLSDINDHGVIAASRTVNAKSRAFVIGVGGELARIDPFEGDIQTFALDINNQGQVVGYSDDPYGPNGGPEGFVWENRRSRRLEFPFEVLFSSANSINNQSQIGGFLIAQEKDEAITGAFILTPSNKKD